MHVTETIYAAETKKINNACGMWGGERFVEAAILTKRMTYELLKSKGGREDENEMGGKCDEQ